MKIERSAFLLLTASLAAVACTSAEESGNDSQAATGANCLNADPATRITAPQAEGFCFDLAVYNDGPAFEGSNSRFFDFVDEQCLAYGQVMKPAVWKKVHGCLNAANALRTPVDGNVPMFDSTTMYSCGRDALESVCTESDAKASCAAMLDGLGDVNQKTKFTKACDGIMSGLLPEGQAQITACLSDIGSSAVSRDVYENNAWEMLDSCVEGLQQAAPVAGGCYDSLASAPTVITDAYCAQLAAGNSVAPFIEAHCKMYGSELRPAAAKKVQACLDAAKSSSVTSRRAAQDASFTALNDAIYDCGRNALKTACRENDDPSLVATCKGIVGTITAKPGHEKENAGGRLTKQCRTFLNALKPSGRTQIEACAASDGYYDLYSCVEGLQSSEP